MANLASSLLRLNVDAKTLSRKTGLPMDRVNDLMSGAEPTVAEILAIASYLRLPPDTLMNFQGTSATTGVKYRKSPKKAPPILANVRALEVANYLSRSGLARKHAIQTLRVHASLMDRRAVEDAASSVRNFLLGKVDDFNPLPNLIDLIDGAGAAGVIVLQNLGVEAAVNLTAGSGLILLSSRTYAPRMLFTCAHEFSHIVLGHTDDGEWVLDQSLGDDIDAIGGAREEEALCNALASAVLLPEKGVVRLLQAARRNYGTPTDSVTSTEIIVLARFFCTSFQVAGARLEYLDILPRGTSATLEEAIRKDHKSVELYAEKLGLPPRSPISIPIISTKLRNELRDAVFDGRISLSRLSEVLGYSIAETKNALA